MVPPKSKILGLEGRWGKTPITVIGTGPIVGSTSGAAP
jgi:hypothetical protein